MPVTVAEVRPLEGMRLWLRFSDGTEGVADLSGLPLPGVLERLKDPAFFRQVRLDPETGTAAWPGGIDLDPLVLHALVLGVVESLEAVPEFASEEEEARFWEGHGLGEGLLSQMAPPPRGLLPPARKKGGAGSRDP